MKYTDLENTLTSALNKLTHKNGTQLKAQQYRKTSNGYIGKRINGTYCSAFTLSEIKIKVNEG
jgi:hypothetical protein